MIAMIALPVATLLRLRTRMKIAVNHAQLASMRAT
eukprot:COSAG02_NODE_36214_length_457_cov_1.377095_1_plen_34_part_10